MLSITGQISTDMKYATIPLPCPRPARSTVQTVRAARAAHALRTLRHLAVLEMLFSWFPRRDKLYYAHFPVSARH